MKKDYFQSKLFGLAFLRKTKYCYPAVQYLSFFLFGLGHKETDLLDKLINFV